MITDDRVAVTTGIATTALADREVFAPIRTAVAMPALPDRSRQAVDAGDDALLCC